MKLEGGRVESQILVLQILSQSMLCRLLPGWRSSLKSQCIYSTKISILVLTEASGEEANFRGDDSAKLFCLLVFVCLMGTESSVDR